MRMGSRPWICAQVRMHAAVHTVDGVRGGDAGVQQRLREALPWALGGRRAAGAGGPAAQTRRGLRAHALRDGGASISRTEPNSI